MGIFDQAKGYPYYARLYPPTISVQYFPTISKPSVGSTLPPHGIAMQVNATTTLS